MVTGPPANARPLCLTRRPRPPACRRCLSRPPPPSPPPQGSPPPHQDSYLHQNPLHRHRSPLPAPPSVASPPPPRLGGSPHGRRTGNTAAADVATVGAVAAVAAAAAAATAAPYARYWLPPHEGPRAAWGGQGATSNAANADPQQDTRGRAPAPRLVSAAPPGWPAVKARRGEKTACTYKPLLLTARVGRSIMPSSADATRWGTPSLGRPTDEVETHCEMSDFPSASHAHHRTKLKFSDRLKELTRGS